MFVGRSSGGIQQQHPSVEVLSAGSGATRLELSPAMTHIAVELGGNWLDEAFAADWGAVPPVLKVIDTATRTPTVTAQGWIAGPVSDRGQVLIVEEHGEEYRYRMRRLGGDGATLALDPPDGIWLMRGVAFGNAVPGDVTGDGRTDLIIITSSGSYEYVCRGGGGFTPDVWIRTDLPMGSVSYF